MSTAVPLTIEPRPVPEEVTTLADLEVGRRGVVRSLGCQGLTRRRLLDLGLVPGTSVEVVMASPAGDPRAYRVRGAMLAIRASAARAIVVTPNS